MRWTALVTVVGLLTTVCPVSAQDASDLRAIAFRDDCGVSLSDIDVTRQRVAAAGWAVVDESADPELEAVMSLARAADPELVSRSTFGAYAKHIGDRQTFLVLSQVPTAQGLANGCYLYDFGEAQLDRSGIIESWIGAQPNETVDYPGLVQQLKWIGPQSIPSMATVRVALIAEGGSVAEQSGFSGAIWAATAFAE